MTRVALRMPAVRALSLTLIVQPLYTAMGAPVQVSRSAKSPELAPAMSMPVTVRGVAPRLMAWIVCTPLVVPAPCLPKYSVVGLSKARGDDGITVRLEILPTVDTGL